MRTLIIVDVQNDFIPGGTLPVPGGESIVPVINRIQDKFDMVVATQDWHPLNHVSFASNHRGMRAFEHIEYEGSVQILWPDHCVQGTKGASFHPDLETDRFAAIFRKGMDPLVDSYSGFFDNNHQISTGLAGYLREKGASNLFFCGLATDICVYFTIKDALKEGFQATLIEDASRALNNESFSIIRKELLSSGVSIISGNDIRYL